MPIDGSFLIGEKAHSFIPNKFDLLAFFLFDAKNGAGRTPLNLLLPYVGFTAIPMNNPLNKL